MPKIEEIFKKCPICGGKIKCLRIFYTELLELDENNDIKKTLSQTIGQPDVMSDTHITGKPIVEFICSRNDSKHFASYTTEQIDIDEKLKTTLDLLPIKTLEQLPSHLKRMVQEIIDQHHENKRRDNEEFNIKIRNEWD
jgi:hypothetical protein